MFGASRALAVSLLLLSSACSDDPESGQPAPQDAGSDAMDGGGGDVATDGAGGGGGQAGNDGSVSIYAPGSATLLSADNPNHLDEDPSVVAAADGSLIIAYFSHRDGNPDIYLKRTFDGVSWTETRITTDPAGDYHPTLTQDETGRFHLTWFRWTALQVGSIHYHSTLDPTSWDESEAQRITNVPDVDDWVPTIARAANGDVLVAFASEKRSPALGSELYLSRKPAGAQSFQPAEQLSQLGSAAHDDTLPIIARDGDDLVLVWVRCDPGGVDPCLSASADLWITRSSDDGQSWDSPAAVTSGGGADALPSIYADHSGARWLIWVSAPSGAGSVVEVPLATPGATPLPRGELTGYSPHVAATPSPGVLLGAWVQEQPGDSNKKDVYYRLFSK